MVQDTLLSLTIGPSSRYGVLRALDEQHKSASPATMRPEMKDFCTFLGKEMNDYFGSVDFDNDLCHLPPQFIKRDDEFGLISPRDMVIDTTSVFLNVAIQLHKDRRDYILNEIERINRIPHGPEKVASKGKFIVEFKETVRLFPQILQYTDDHLDFSSILDHIASGPFADMDLAEWIIQMKGLGLRGLQLTRMSLSGSSVNRSKTHLTLACISQMKKQRPHEFWAVLLMIAATQFLDFNFCSRDDPSGNTALHYVCLAGNMEMYMLMHNNQYKHGNAKKLLPELLFSPQLMKALGIQPERLRVVSAEENIEILKRQAEKSAAASREFSASIDQRTANVNNQLQRDFAASSSSSSFSKSASKVPLASGGGGVGVSSCATCGSTHASDDSSSKLLICSGCRTVAYCCKEHQKIDWKRHKLLCSPAPK